MSAHSEFDKICINHTQSVKGVELDCVGGYRDGDLKEHVRSGTPEAGRAPPGHSRGLTHVVVGLDFGANGRQADGEDVAGHGHVFSQLREVAVWMCKSMTLFQLININ